MSAPERVDTITDELSPAAAARRLAAVDAFVDLVLDAGTPSPEAIAERAGVSRATFFRYFSTLGELRTEALLRVTERFPDLLEIPDLGVGGLDDRLRNFVDARLRLHETLHRLELVTREYATHDTESAAFVNATRAVLADQVRRHFATELQRFSPAHGDDVVTSIAVLTSVEAWQQFRHSHERTPVQTRRAWRHAIAAVLATPSRG